MGGASSKVVRKLPTKAKPTWAGARTAPAAETTHERPRASDTRNEAIDNDSRDPQFMANLSRLGPVTVDHHMTTVHPDAHMTNMTNLLHRRGVSEQQASSAVPTQNRILASSLTDLLEERKSVTSQPELEKLAKRYDMDVGVLESLSRFVTSPSVGGDTVTRTVNESGQEKVTMMAVWSEPLITPDPKARISS